MARYEVHVCTSLPRAVNPLGPGGKVAGVWEEIGDESPGVCMLNL